jgi:hypothetical protein
LSRALGAVRGYFKVAVSMWPAQSQLISLPIEFGAQFAVPRQNQNQRRRHLRARLFLVRHLVVDLLLLLRLAMGRKVNIVLMS